MKLRLGDPEAKGIFIVDRRTKQPAETVEQVASVMWRFCQLDRRGRIELRNRTENLSELLDWRNLNKSYAGARQLALDRFYSAGPQIQKVPVSKNNNNDTKTATTTTTSTTK